MIISTTEENKSGVRPGLLGVGGQMGWPGRPRLEENRENEKAGDVGSRTSLSGTRRERFYS